MRSNSSRFIWRRTRSASRLLKMVPVTWLTPSTVQLSMGRCFRGAVRPSGGAPPDAPRLRKGGGGGGGGGPPAPPPKFRTRAGGGGGGGGGGAPPPPRFRKGRTGAEVWLGER